MTIDVNNFNVDYDDDEEMLSRLDSCFEEMDEEEGSIDSSVKFVENIDAECSENAEKVNLLEGMRVDVLDEEYTWSLASICCVHKDNTVVVVCNGLEDEHDEDLPCPSLRIAKMLA